MPPEIATVPVEGEEENDSRLEPLSYKLKRIHKTSITIYISQWGKRFIKCWLYLIKGENKQNKMIFVFYLPIVWFLFMWI